MADAKEITLPTLTVEQLDNYYESAAAGVSDAGEKEILRGKGETLIELVYTDDFLHEKVTRSDKSKIIDILKKYTVLSRTQSDDGVLKKANKNEINMILNQATFGTTGTFIKLIHSGFGVKLKPIQAIERADFQHAIATSIIPVTRMLSGDLYTGVYAKIVREVIRLFLKQLEFSTADIPGRNLENILKYIKLKDLNLIMVGVLKLMYPDGYDSFRYICGEIIKVDKDGSTTTKSCGVESDVLTIDMNELVYVDDESFSAFELSLLNTTSRNSIKIDEVIKYQEGYKYNQPLSVDITEDLKFTLDSGSIENYLTKSEEWLNKVVIESDSFAPNNIDTIVKIIENSAVGRYFYCIDSITSGDVVIDKKDFGVDEVKTLSTNPGISTAIEYNSKSMLNNSGYLVAVPKYTCPSCEARLKENPNTEEENTNPNSDIITNLNVIDLFIYLA